MKKFVVPSRWTPLLVLLTLLVLPSCGDDLERAAVLGRVTLDGNPLQGGTVRFIAEGAPLAGIAAAEIVDGEYRLDATSGPVVGRNRVEISSYQKTGSQREVAPGKWRDEYQQVIPERYNIESRETVDIVAGENQINFALEPR